MALSTPNGYFELIEAPLDQLKADIIAFQNAVDDTIGTLSSGGLVSPLTTKGDIWGFSTDDARIPVGSNGHVLTADSAEALGVKWVAPAGFANPMTTLGDVIYGGAAGAATRLAGNTTAAKQFLIQTGNGSVSAAPAWGALAAGDIPDLSGTYQPLDGDLTAIAGLSPSNDDIIQLKSGAWVNRTVAQYKADLALTNVTNDAQTKVAVVPNTLPASGQVLVGNAGGTAYAPVTVSGDVTITNAGVTAIGASKVTNAMLAGSIAASKLIGTDIATVGTLTAGATGAGFTVALSTSTITGTLADARLSANVAFRNAANSFAGHQTPSLTDTYDLGSSTLLWRKGYLSELDAVLFAQNTVSVIGGWLLIAKGEGTVDEDVDTSETQIDFGANNIAVNDFIIFRAAGAVEYMQATSLVSGNTWNVTRNLDGSGANAWPQGSVWVNLGYNGTGRIELNANSTPRISVFTQGTSYNSQTELLRMGDLNGWGSYVAETYGFATGQYGAASKTWETIEQTNGIRLGLNTTTLFQVDTSGSVTMGEVANNQGNVFWNTTNKRLEFRGSTAGTVVQAYVDTTGAIKAGAGTVTLDTNGISIKQGAGTSNQLSLVNTLNQPTGYLRSLNSGYEITDLAAMSVSPTHVGGGMVLLSSRNSQGNATEIQIISEDSAALNRGWIAMVGTTGYSFRGLNIGSTLTPPSGILLSVEGGVMATSFNPTGSAVPADGLYLPAFNTLGFAVNSTGEIQLTATALSPITADGNALGTTALPWSDLHLAEGGVINWDNGDVTITQAGNLLTFAGASTGYVFDAPGQFTGINLIGPSGVNTFSFDTPGSTFGRITTVSGVSDWFATTINANYSSGWNLDVTAKDGWFFKLDVRATGNSPNNGLHVFRIPTGANPHTDEYSLLGITHGETVFNDASTDQDFRVESDASTHALFVDGGTSNVKIAGSAVRATTEGTNHVDIFNGTAPVGTLTNGISIYSSAGECYIMDAAGNATLQSPHDRDTGEWIFYSKNTITGKVLRIDMERMMKALNKEMQGDFIREYTEH